MKVKLEDFKTGWHGASLGFKKNEIDRLILKLERLKKNEIGHFHFRSSFVESGD